MTWIYQGDRESSWGKAFRSSNSLLRGQIADAHPVQCSPLKTVSGKGISNGTTPPINRLYAPVQASVETVHMSRRLRDMH
jgi:hypothetical protein